MPKLNKEGLTYDEWYAAATLGGKFGNVAAVNLTRMHWAWQRGEDPTEWASFFEKGGNHAHDH